MRISSAVLYLIQSVALLLLTSCTNNEHDYEENNKNIKSTDLIKSPDNISKNINKNINRDTSKKITSNVISKQFKLKKKIIFAQFHAKELDRSALTRFFDKRDKSHFMPLSQLKKEELKSLIFPSINTSDGKITAKEKAIINKLLLDAKDNLFDRNKLRFFSEAELQSLYAEQSKNNINNIHKYLTYSFVLNAIHDAIFLGQGSYFDSKNKFFIDNSARILEAFAVREREVQQYIMTSLGISSKI
jgi:hypothetical protein